MYFIPFIWRPLCQRERSTPAKLLSYFTTHCISSFVSLWSLWASRLQSWTVLYKVGIKVGFEASAFPPIRVAALGATREPSAAYRPPRSDGQRPLWLMKHRVNTYLKTIYFSPSVFKDKRQSTPHVL